MALTIWITMETTIFIFPEMPLLIHQIQEGFKRDSEQVFEHSPRPIVSLFYYL